MSDELVEEVIFEHRKRFLPHVIREVDAVDGAGPRSPASGGFLGLSRIRCRNPHAGFGGLGRAVKRHTTSPFRANSRMPSDRSVPVMPGVPARRVHPTRTHNSRPLGMTRFGG